MSPLASKIIYKSFTLLLETLFNFTMTLSSLNICSQLLLGMQECFFFRIDFT
jgi:hypothetical protein